MYDAEHVIRARRKWLELYAATKNAALVCRRCGISPPTLRKWWQRYLAQGESGLRSHSRRPHRSLGGKLTDEYIGWIIEMRAKRNHSPRRTVHNAVRFLKEHVLEEFPFPIQRIQTDCGREFFGTPFQRALMDQAIKFRPTRSYSPHLDGKVERSQRTDRVEFYATV